MCVFTLYCVEAYTHRSVTKQCEQWG